MLTLKNTIAQLNLDPKISKQCQGKKSFPFKTTKEFAKRIEVGKIDDPLLLQILPRKKQLQNTLKFTADPLKEQVATPIPGLLHKYFGRVLLLVTKHCAINCRFCFRQNLPHKLTQWRKALNYIAADPSINEVILSGGDPLTLTDTKLQTIVQKLATIKHIQRIRIHTRMPIVQPKRITTKLITALTASKLPIVFVVHVNHPQEIDAEVIAAIARLRHVNITVFNQTVVLNGVNDNLDTLMKLSEKLFATGIIPYYLHLLDWVRGAENFYVPLKKMQLIMRELHHKLPGYLVPKLVYEKPGAKTKIMVA